MGAFKDFLSNPLSMATHFLSSLFGGGASSGILGMPGLPGLPAGLFGGSSAAAESAPGLPAAGPAPADTPAFTAAWAPESAPSAQGAPAPLAPARAAGAAHMAHKHVHAHAPHAKQADPGGAAAPAAAQWDHIVEAVHRMGAARWEAARARLATSTPARRLLREGGPAGRTSGRAAAPLDMADADGAYLAAAPSEITLGGGGGITLKGGRGLGLGVSRPAHGRAARAPEAGRPAEAGAPGGTQQGAQPDPTLSPLEQRALDTAGMLFDLLAAALGLGGEAPADAMTLPGPDAAQEAATMPLALLEPSEMEQPGARAERPAGEPGMGAGMREQERGHSHDHGDRGGREERGGLSDRDRQRYEDMRSRAKAHWMAAAAAAAPGAGSVGWDQAEWGGEQPHEHHHHHSHGDAATPSDQLPAGWEGAGAPAEGWLPDAEGALGGRHHPHMHHMHHMHHDGNMPGWASSAAPAAAPAMPEALAP